MKSFLTGVLLIVSGILIAGIIALTTAPVRGEPITLLPPPTPLPFAVEVKGAVSRPGLVFLPQHSRVQHALDAAGGPLPHADLSAINLAAPLIDGTQIVVPTLPSSSEAPQQDEPAPPASRININTATAGELADLPGIDSITAQRIIEYRTQFGPFKTIEDLTLVFGIGPSTLEQIKHLITVGS